MSAYISNRAIVSQLAHMHAERIMQSGHTSIKLLVGCESHGHTTTKSFS